MSLNLTSSSVSTRWFSVRSSLIWNKYAEREKDTEWIQNKNQTEKMFDQIEMFINSWIKKAIAMYSLMQ